MRTRGRRSSAAHADGSRRILRVGTSHGGALREPGRVAGNRAGHPRAGRPGACARSSLTGRSLAGPVQALPGDMVEAPAPRQPRCEPAHARARSWPRCRTSLKPAPDEHGLHDAYAQGVAPHWTSWHAPLNRYLAAKAFANWTAYQGRGLLSIVRGLEAALALVRVEAARQCRDARRPLDAHCCSRRFAAPTSRSTTSPSAKTSRRPGRRWRTDRLSAPEVTSQHPSCPGGPKVPLLVRHAGPRRRRADVYGPPRAARGDRQGRSDDGVGRTFTVRRWRREPRCRLDIGAMLTLRVGD